MKAVFERIWEIALPYQDKRDDAGHAEVTLRFAKELVALDGGNVDVIIPAIMLHDVGWSQLPTERRMRIFAKDTKDEERLALQIEHQNEGAKLASNILREVSYPEDLTKEILDIISRHDSGQGFNSKNEGLVRDADKLWRTSKEGFAAGPAKKNPIDEEHLKKAEERISKPGYFYSEKARQMALADFKLRLLEKHCSPLITDAQPSSAA